MLLPAYLYCVYLFLQVCSVPMNPADGFDAVSSSGEKKPLTRYWTKACLGFVRI